VRAPSPIDRKAQFWGRFFPTKGKKPLGGLDGDKNGSAVPVFGTAKPKKLFMKEKFRTPKRNVSKTQSIFSKVFGILNPFFQKGVKQGLGQSPKGK